MFKICYYLLKVGFRVFQGVIKQYIDIPTKLGYHNADMKFNS